jgi:hypothetical protein
VHSLNEPDAVPAAGAVVSEVDPLVDWETGVTPDPADPAADDPLPASARLSIPDPTDDRDEVDDDEDGPVVVELLPGADPSPPTAVIIHVLVVSVGTGISESGG